ncbi:MAG TPA: hypothetical protein PK854_10925 [Oscillospiraceae bacterium]|nr:hypothetical protein [Oscillospiraceae bacterium]HPS35764.1 hypothetical protein [Oscillospiraceae bacterium]
MGHFGFSYLGLIFLLMMFIPNLIWSKNLPKDFEEPKENKILLIFERVGQASTFILVLIFSDFNFHGWKNWTWWLITAFIVLLLYECWWIRYFTGPKTMAAFYSDFIGIPVAGAILPVAAFFLLGVYGKVIWLMISAVLFGVGHIGIHLQHKKELSFKS